MSDITPIAEKLEKINADMELILKLQQDLSAQTERVMELTLAMPEKDQMIADMKETIGEELYEGGKICVQLLDSVTTEETCILAEILTGQWDMDRRL